MDVGLALKAAVERAKQHEAMSTRRLRVRLATRWAEDANDGLWITAAIAARSGEELEAQTNAGSRVIPWEQLTARAHELAAVVDEVVAEVEAAVGVKARG